MKNNQKKTNQRVIFGSSVLALSSVSSSVMAQTSAPTNATEGITQVNDAVSGVGTVAGAAVTFVLLAMGVRLAIKQVNRVMVKG